MADPAAPVALAAPAQVPALRVEGLRFRWPGAASDVLVIDHMQVAAGERVLLRGDSGCGKSTLLSLAAGVLLPQAGTVDLMGQPWRGFSAAGRDRRRADHLGYIFQQFNLLPYLSALDNVLLPCRFSALRAQRSGATPALRGQRAQALLSALQLPPGLWQSPAAQLSVGQQQRVAAARALIGQPALVIADEPTSALDEGRRDAFMALLTQVCDEAGSALLFVSHDARLAPHFGRVVDLPALNQAAMAERDRP
jgi:putative ABC transport system ATP-binding protein